ncbi:ATP/GTP-binding protein [Sphingobacterium thalpophilum]|uniref:AAA family ATPase n=1 Tax=Sphingobacterium thalpophilum TaxID=259 RepID=UPI0031CED917
MIEEFSFGNFWSFKDIQTLNMTAAKIKSKNALLDNVNLFSVDDHLSLIKAKAIYGANASGKSNVIKALVAFIRIIKDSVKEEKALNIISAFQLSTETSSEPTFFQLIFRIDKIRYRYGFEADDESIKSEWLYSTPNKREQLLFVREDKEIIEINQKHFEEGVLYKKLFKNSEDPIFTNSSLFLTHLASTGFGKISKLLIKSISSISIISGLGDRGMFSIAGESLNDSIKKKFILDFLQNADIGIDNLETIEITNDDLSSEAIDEKVKENLKKSKIVVSSKTKYNAELKAEGESRFLFGIQESEGTKKMFELSPFIYRSLKNGTPLIIDEFDSRFHPLLTKKIVELYNSFENKTAQLIFTTHDTNLLSSDILRRDQIDFIEKDRYGASHLYTLVELKGIRNDASFEKDYFQGKYGAIPFLGNFTNLLSFE